MQLTVSCVRLCGHLHFRRFPAWENVILRGWHAISRNFKRLSSSSYAHSSVSALMPTLRCKWFSAEKDNCEAAENSSVIPSFFHFRIETLARGRGWQKIAVGVIVQITWEGSEVSWESSTRWDQKRELSSWSFDHSVTLSFLIKSFCKGKVDYPRLKREIVVARCHW